MQLSRVHNPALLGKSIRSRATAHLHCSSIRAQSATRRKNIPPSELECFQLSHSQSERPSQCQEHIQQDAVTACPVQMGVAAQQPQEVPAAGSLHRLAAVAAVWAAAKLQWQKLSAWCHQHRVKQLLIGGDAGAALAAMSVVPLLPGGGVTDLFTNRVFLAGFWAWFTAQTLKIFTKYLKKGVWDLKAIVDSGGMPSSHSALCAGITTAIAYQHGMGSSAFALAVALSSIVMYDAAGVRRHAGKQAEVLNQVIGELLEGHPVSDVKLKEVLGHTPLQVCCGAVLGVLFGVFFPAPEPLTAATQHLMVAA